MRISISFLDFSSAEELKKALDAVKAQSVSAELELIICDPQKKLDESKFKELLAEESVVMCADPDDSLGVLQATGEYIAFCKEGYTWCSNEKLSRQVSVLEGNSQLSLVLHDVELLKQDGRPVDQNIRHRYICALGFEERRYGLQNLERFDDCGFSGTWLLRNIFLNEKERTLYQASALIPEVALLTLLIANGEAENLFADRFVSCFPNENGYERKVKPTYDTTDASKKIQELVDFQSLLQENYSVETDGTCRRLHIADGAFNYFSANAATEETVKQLLSVFEEVYRPEYQNLEDLEIGKPLFCTLRDKICEYLTRCGTSVCLPLVPCLDGISDDMWSCAIRRCKNNTLRKAMFDRFESLNPNARGIVAEDRRKENPVRMFSGRVIRKLKKLCWKVIATGRKLILLSMRKKGFSGYMSREWCTSVCSNFFADKETPLKKKIWCYRRGFMPWRIHQYDLTEKNFKEYLSDRDYMYLHQINNSYKKWIEDKMTFRLVLEPFKEYLPKYYFQIIQRDRQRLIVRLPDCPADYEPTFDELLRLLRQEGKLALKAASGTHGVGFYKMHYEDGKYYMNNEETSAQGIRDIIDGFKSFYVVTNYINMHDQIKEIYSGSVNTIRIMMINRDGHHPQLMDAYMRVGSKKSGVTDNVAFGGVVCSIDLETGEYGDGMQIKDHRFIRIDTHPDTGTALQGVIPNWELIKQGIVDISSYLCQLEYLGFDVVCTPEGFTLLEINSHQDLHRLRYYDPRVKDFFFYKLHNKEHRFKIKRHY